LQQACTGVVE